MSDTVSLKALEEALSTLEELAEGRRVEAIRAERELAQSGSQSWRDALEWQRTTERHLVLAALAARLLVEAVGVVKKVEWSDSDYARTCKIHGALENCCVICDKLACCGVHDPDCPVGALLEKVEP